MADSNYGPKPPIDRSQMTRRWWVEATIKVVLLCSIVAVGGTAIGDSLNRQPRWAFDAEFFAAFVLFIPLYPFPPRVGEQQLSLKESIYGVFAIAAMFVGLIALAGALWTITIGYVAVTGMIGPPIGHLLEKPAFWLAVIAYLLLLIYARLGERK